MTFNSKATLHVKLPQVSANKPQTLEFLTKELEKIRFSGGATQKLAEALVMAGAQVFPENAKSARETKKVRFSNFSLGTLPLGPYIFKLPFEPILPDVIYHSDPFFLQAVIVFTDGKSDDTANQLERASWTLRKQRLTTKEGEKVNAVRIMAISIGDNLNVVRFPCKDWG